MNRALRVITVGVACLAAVVAVAACGSSKSNSSKTSPASSAAATSTSSSSSAAASTGITAADVSLASQYVGGHTGKANPSLSPVTVGFLTQEGTVPSFPEDRVAANAAVALINDKLGGIQGHPLKLNTCVLQTEEDGLKCASQMLAAKVPLANLSLSEAGNGTFYKTINGKFPTIVTVTSSTPDEVTPDVYSPNGGAAAILYAMADDAKLLGATSVASIGSGNPGGRYAGDKVLIPQLGKLGVKVKNVYYSDTVDTPGIVSALEAAGVSSAGAVILDPSSPTQCLSVYDGLKQLSLTKPVITTPICNADSFVNATGAGPEGWDIFSYVTNPRITDDPSVKVYRDAMTASGGASDITVGFAAQQFAATMTIAKLANQIGPAKISATTFRQAIKAFRGPAFMTPGLLYCGANLNPSALTSCGSAVAKSTFKNGKWIADPSITDPQVKFSK